MRTALRGTLRSLIAAAALVAVAPALAGPISAGQGMGALGPRSHECQPGAEAAGRDGCKPFLSGDVSREGDVRCFERPTPTGNVRICRD